MNNIPEIQENVLMAGFPSTGKSTFLAAFWQLVETQSDQVKGSLRLYDKRPPETKYLNEIRDAWAKYEPIPRNKTIEINDAYMILNKGDAVPFKLRFPDVSGETYTEICERRTWNEEFHALVSKTNRLLLFLNEDSLTLAPTIAEVNEVSPDAGPTTANEETEEWGPEKVPKEVQYIDLLQLLLAPQAGVLIKKVSIVISAWDKQVPENIDPESWLKKHANMLYQFIKANTDKAEFKVFGVSAQGDEYADDKIDELAEKPLSERPKLAGGKDTSVNEHDITYPVRWLFE